MFMEVYFWRGIDLIGLHHGQLQRIRGIERSNRFA
jgi:hypothetical protein